MDKSANNINKIGIFSATAALTILLSSCWTPSNTSVPQFNYFDVSSCTVEKWTEKNICVEKVIQKINNDWVKTCVSTNISENKTVSNAMKWTEAIDDKIIQDISNLVKECTYYNETKKEKSNNDYPVFTAFATAAVGSFVWSAISDAVFNDYYKSPSRRNCYYSNSKDCDGSGYGYGNFINNNYSKYSSNTNSDTVKTKAERINEIKNTSSKDNIAVQKMKSASSANNNDYKLGDTSKKWWSISNQSKSTKSSSSWGNSSSSKSSSSSVRSSGRSSGFGG